jgi:hypothetical protein
MTKSSAINTFAIFTILASVIGYVAADGPSGLGLRTGYTGNTRGQRDASYNSVRDFNNNSFSAGDLPGYKPANGSGVLGSSMYKASPQTRSPGSIGAPPRRPSTSSLMGKRPTSTRISTPTTPMVIRPTAPPRRPTRSRTSTLSYRSGTQLTLLAPILADKDVKPIVLPTREITSLVPDRQNSYRDHMLKGEDAFRRGLYKESAKYFSQARVSSVNSPESLLSLAHANLALADGSYGRTAVFLGKTVDRFPQLPAIKVHPASFFGKTDDYQKVLKKLQKFGKDNPKDASAEFVLAYLTWRDKRFLLARQMVRQAIKNCRDTDLSRQMQTMLAGMAVDKKTLMTLAPKMGEAINFPHAGVKLALPVGFKLQQLAHINKVFVAAQNAGGAKKPRSIAMSVYPLEGNVTKREFMNQMINRAKQDPSIKDVKVVEERTIPFLKTTALARLVTCRYHGSPVAVVRMCFSRSIKQPGWSKDTPPTKFMYQLGVGVLIEDTDSLLPAFAAVVDSISLTKLKSPVDLLKDAAGSEIADTQLGFAITLPSGWAGRKTPTGFEMGQMDIAGGGIVTPGVKVLLAIVPESFTPQSLAKNAFKLRMQEGYKITVLSDKPAKLGQKEGRQFVIRKTAPKDEPKTPTDGVVVKPRGSYIEAGRLILTPDKKGKKRMFALVVTCHKSSEAQAQALLETFAKRFRLLKK